MELQRRQTVTIRTGVTTISQQSFKQEWSSWPDSLFRLLRVGLPPEEVVIQGLAKKEPRPTVRPILASTSHARGPPPHLIGRESRPGVHRQQLVQQVRRFWRLQASAATTEQG
jgi:hypothetical protein